MKRVWFLLGLFIGGTVGFLAAAALSTAKNSDATIERWRREVREFNEQQDNSPPDQPL